MLLKPNYDRFWFGELPIINSFYVKMLEKLKPKGIKVVGRLAMVRNSIGKGNSSHFNLTSIGLLMCGEIGWNIVS